MNKQINDIVSKTLTERYQISQTFNLILENDELSDDDKFDKIADSLADLESLGKSDEEIEGDLSEGIMDFVNKYLSPGQDKTSSETGINKGAGDIKQKVSSAFMSQIREFIIVKGLGMLGFKGKLASSLAAAFADLNLKAIISVFRGGSECKKYGPQVVDGIAEGLAAYLLHDVESDSIIGQGLRQTAAEYFKASELGEIIAGKICDFDMKGAISKYV
jgi:hypothetical protein